MQNIHLLSRLFDEELHLIASQFFNTTIYKDYLESFHTQLNSHFRITLKEDDEGTLHFLSHMETPFHHKSIASYKSNYTDLLKTPSYSYLMDHLKGLFKESITFKNAFMKYSGANKEKDELQYIEVDLFVNLPFTTISEETLTYYYYHKLMEHIRKEILSDIQNLYFDQQKTESERTILIRKYQNKIGYYLSYLELHFSKFYDDPNFDIISIKKTLNDVFKCIHINLEKIISYMEDCLYDYMDKEQPISYLQRSAFIKEYRTPAKELVALIKLQKLPKEIELSICKPLNSIIENKLKTFSYLRRDYCHTYITIFKALLTKIEPVSHDDIYKLLIALNYNNHNIFKNIEQEFLFELEKRDQIGDKQSYLYTKLAKVNRIAITSSVKYHLNLPGLKEYLIEFITEMLHLYEQQTELIHMGEKIIELENTPPPNPENKRRVSINANEIALLARLFYDCGVSQLEKGKHKYFKLLASNYATKDGAALSENNIKNSFYSPKQNSCLSIEKLLISMLGKLQKIKNNNTFKKASV